MSAALDAVFGHVHALRRRRRLTLLGLAALVPLIAALSSAVGAVSVPAWSLIGAPLDALGLWDSGLDPMAQRVLMAIRLPRVALGALVGAGLATSGAALQGLLRNPLADPGLLGVSSGATLGVIALILIAPTAPLWLTALTTPVAAFLGGWAAALLLLAMAYQSGRASVTTMLLAGIAINALAGACIGLATFFADDAQLRSWTMWSLGSLGGASWTQVGVTAAVLVPAIGALWRDAGALDLMTLGTNPARHLGVNPVTVRRRVVALSALIVGVCTCFTGIIGFVGLVVPHVGRLLHGPSHRTLLPGSALLGAALLMMADVIARTIASPAELPLGVITALVGAPCFLWLLRARMPGAD